MAIPNKNSGYVGLIMMLISVVIIALLVWKFGILAVKSGSGDKSKNAVGNFDISAEEMNTTPGQSGIPAIEQAKSIKNILEQKDRQALQQ